MALSGLLFMFPCMRLFLFLFFFNDTATTEIYTLSLHDALPISGAERAEAQAWASLARLILGDSDGTADRKSTRLNSSHVAISYAVFCLKKKTEAGGARQIVVRNEGEIAGVESFLAKNRSSTSSSIFFFNDTATTEIYTLSLHDALPISSDGTLRRRHRLLPGPLEGQPERLEGDDLARDRKSTRLNSSHVAISYAVF